MTDEFEGNTDEETDDFSSGKIADSPSVVEDVFSEALREKFEIFSYRNAVAILANSFPKHFASIVHGLESFQISQEMIRTPGGSKGPIAKYVDTLFTEDEGWQEARITADLHVKLLHAKRKDEIIAHYIREEFLDGHRIGFLNGRVALSLEQIARFLNRFTIIKSCVNFLYLIVLEENL